MPFEPLRQDASSFCAAEHQHKELESCPQTGVDAAGLGFVSKFG